jgi:hypothetical protein
LLLSHQDMTGPGRGAPTHCGTGKLASNGPAGRRDFATWPSDGRGAHEREIGGIHAPGVWIRPLSQLRSRGHPQADLQGHSLRLSFSNARGGIASWPRRVLTKREHQDPTHPPTYRTIVRTSIIPTLQRPLIPPAGWDSASASAPACVPRAVCPATHTRSSSLNRGS